MARQVLGKGLSALIQQNQISASLTQQMNDEKRVIVANVSEIQLSPFQPRHTFKDEQIQELAKSIRERGLVQPLVVRRVEGKFELIAGERRREKPWPQGSEGCGDESYGPRSSRNHID